MKLRIWQVLLAAMVLTLPAGLTGCGAFFVCAKASCTTNGTNSSLTGAYAFVTNSASSTEAINGYALSTGTPVIGTGFPYTLTYAPSALAVSTNNRFLYIGSNTTLTGGLSAIYGYTIGTGGALTALQSSPLVASNVAAMDVSPDGQWLVVLSSGDGQTLPTTVSVFGLNSSTGLITGTASTLPATSATSLPNTPVSLKVAPSAQYVAIALGTGGAAVFPFSTTNGALGIEQPVTAANSLGNTLGIFDVAADSSNNLFIASVGVVKSLVVSPSGVPAGAYLSSQTTSSTAPYAVAVDGTSFVYGAAMISSTVSSVFEFSNTSGTLAALNPASVTASPTTTKMAMDSTNRYLLTLGYGSSGLQMFSVGSGGALTFVGSQATGSSTSVPSYIAMTH